MSCGCPGPTVPAALSFNFTKHGDAHVACGCDPIPWQQIHAVGTVANIPVASVCNAGYFYLATDGVVPELFYSDGTQWLSVNGSTSNQALLVPVITSANAASVAVNTPLLYQVTATNSPTSFGATGLPAGLSINGVTGQIAGTPTTPGVYGVQLTATNANGTGTGAVVITVTGGNAAPAIQPPLSATGNVGQAFAFGVTATGGTPITFAFGGLPPGLTGNANGLISGVPTTQGNYAVSVTATSAFGNDSDTVVISIGQGQVLSGFVIWTFPPPPQTAFPGQPGMISFDNNGLYLCVAPNFWIYIPGGTF